MAGGITEHVKSVCRIGQGAQCCRYLLMGQNGFECGKQDEVMRRTIDARVIGFTAKSDNCEGKQAHHLNENQLVEQTIDSLSDDMDLSNRYD